MKKWIIGLIVAVCMTLGAGAWAQPQIPPVPTGGIYVQDYAGVLSGETKTKINQLGSKIDKQTRAQVVVVTVKSLEGSSIQNYSLTLLRQWKIGDKSLDNGVLLLVSVGDKASRIEVGYGLEGAINDAKAGRIQDEYLIPYLQRDEYDQGIWNTYKAVMREVSGEYGIASPQDNKGGTQGQTQGWWDGLPGWAQIAVLVGFVSLFLLDWVFLGGRFTFLLLYLLRLRGGGGGKYGGGSSGGGGADRKW